MRLRSLFFTLCLSFIGVSTAAVATIRYDVDFEGLDDAKTLKEIRLASQLTSLQKRPPASINALRYRADSDIPSLISVLQSQGYYEAKVHIQIYELSDNVEVVVRINPGPRYTLGSFDIQLYCHSPDITHTCCQVTLDQIGITLHKPAQAQTIIQGELNILQRLSECGYPLAKLENRDVVVDGQTKQVHVRVDVKTGEQLEFGPVTIEGTKRVKEKFIEQKLEWKENTTYDSRPVEQTQSALIDTGLFSSVLISHEQTPSLQGTLPIKIEVSETKYQSVNVGVSYQTVFGPGITFGWENRNVAGMGRTLRFQGDVTRISQTGVAAYVHPDFNCAGQTMIVQAEAAHEDIFAYSMRSYSVMDRFERVVSEHLRGSLGLQGDRLYVTASAQNGNYWLIQLPFYLRWSTADNLLNPSRGVTIEYTGTPVFNSANTNEFYLTQQLITSAYKAIDRNSRVILAQKLTLGVICSNGLSAVPLSNRFLGGSESDLRGYRYKSVSPLVDGKPIGGRSALYYSAEMRLRVTEVLGLVPFFDLGNVYTTFYPSWHHRWFKSAGLGFRFFTFMGPFRLDVGIPLDRRKKIDPHYKILVSIGQMF